MVAPVSNGRLVGYARVSTDDQNLTLQIDSLTNLGINPNDIYTEKISGAKTDRPELNACLVNLQQGDTLVVWRLVRSSLNCSGIRSVGGSFGIRSL
jgi:DNA invertase Pin-like site-specific DNA recombinase